MTHMQGGSTGPVDPDGDDELEKVLGDVEDESFDEGETDYEDDNPLPGAGSDV